MNFDNKMLSKGKVEVVWFGRLLDNVDMEWERLENGNIGENVFIEELLFKRSFEGLYNKGWY